MRYAIALESCAHCGTCADPDKLKLTKALEASYVDAEMRPRLTANGLAAACAARLPKPLPEAIHKAMSGDPRRGR